MNSITKEREFLKWFVREYFSEKGSTGLRKASEKSDHPECKFSCTRLLVLFCRSRIAYSSINSFLKNIHFIIIEKISINK